MHYVKYNSIKMGELALFLLVVVACANISKSYGTDECQDLDQEVQELRSEIITIKRFLRQQQSVTKTQEQQLGSHDLKLRHHERLITNQGRMIEILTQKTAQIENKNAYSEFGCLEDVITLSCTDERRINVTRATYGQYSQNCEETCCSPYPSDCTEDVSQSDQPGWIALLVECNNKTSCDVEYTGHVISECDSGYVADYMQIFFDCLPEPVEEFIAFTAVANTDREYDLHDIVVFEKVVLNIGNGYNNDSSFFTCPTHGVYEVGVNFYAQQERFMDVDIMRDEESLVSAWADDGYVIAHASANVITECDVGQVLWVRAGASACHMYSFPTYAASHFYAHLLYRPL